MVETDGHMGFAAWFRRRSLVLLHSTPSVGRQPTSSSTVHLACR
eukprot:COSAG01_NODE_53158_length_341_cov_0.756198_1_plen_43_part_01